MLPSKDFAERVLSIERCQALMISLNLRCGPVATRQNLVLKPGGARRDAPDVDPLVFLAEPAAGLPPLAAGQLRRCRITGSSLFDLEAQPVA